MSKHIAERLSASLYKAAEILIMHGASPYEVDDALVEFGFEMGPCEQQDLIGLDVSYKSRKSDLEKYYPHLCGLIISDRMVEDGKLGKKVNAGWYRYPGGNGKVEDPIVEDLIIEESYFAKVDRQEITSSEITTFIFAGVINEACRLLDENETITTIQIDKFAKQALVLPESFGGLMAYASSLNLKEFQASLTNINTADAGFCKIATGIKKAFVLGVDLQYYYARVDRSC